MKTPADLDIDAVRAALSGRVIGGRLLYHDVLSSTMDKARLLAGEGWPEGLVVVTEHQTAGRGRLDRDRTHVCSFVAPCHPGAAHRKMFTNV